MLQWQLKIQRLTCAASLLALFASLVASQITAGDREPTVTAKDKQVILRIAKSFVADMQRTRDVGLLFDKYYYPRFARVFQDEPALFAFEYKGPKLSEAFLRRAYRAEANELYLVDLSYFATGTDHFGGLFPGFPDTSLDQEAKTPADFLRQIQRSERQQAKMFPILRRKDFESTAAYKTKLASYKDCDYSVADDRFDGDDIPRSFLRQFPRGTPLFMVTTPIGLSVMFERHRNSFRILATAPCPWD